MKLGTIGAASAGAIIPLVSLAGPWGSVALADDTVENPKPTPRTAKVKGITVPPHVAKGVGDFTDMVNKHISGAEKASKIPLPRIPSLPSPQTPVVGSAPVNLLRKEGSENIRTDKQIATSPTAPPAPLKLSLEDINRGVLNTKLKGIAASIANGTFDISKLFSPSGNLVQGNTGRKDEATQCTTGRVGVGGKCHSITDPAVWKSFFDSIVNSPQLKNLNKAKNIDIFNPQGNTESERSINGLRGLIDAFVTNPVKTITSLIDEAGGLQKIAANPLSAVAKLAVKIIGYDGANDLLRAFGFILLAARQEVIPTLLKVLPLALVPILAALLGAGLGALKGGALGGALAQINPLTWILSIITKIIGGITGGSLGLIIGGILGLIAAVLISFPLALLLPLILMGLGIALAIFLASIPLIIGLILMLTVNIILGILVGIIMAIIMIVIVIVASAGVWAAGIAYPGPIVGGFGIALLTWGVLLLISMGVAAILFVIKAVVLGPLLATIGLALGLLAAVLLPLILIPLLTIGAAIIAGIFGAILGSKIGFATGWIASTLLHTALGAILGGIAGGLLFGAISSALALPIGAILFWALLQPGLQRMRDHLAKNPELQGSLRRLADLWDKAWNGYGDGKRAADQALQDYLDGKITSEDLARIRREQGRGTGAPSLFNQFLQLIQGALNRIWNNSREKSILDGIGETFAPLFKALGEFGGGLMRELMTEETPESTRKGALLGALLGALAGLPLGFLSGLLSPTNLIPGLLSIIPGWAIGSKLGKIAGNLLSALIALGTKVISTVILIPVLIILTGIVLVGGALLLTLFSLIVSIVAPLALSLFLVAIPVAIILIPIGLFGGILACLGTLYAALASNPAFTAFLVAGIPIATAIVTTGIVIWVTAAIISIPIWLVLSAILFLILFPFFLLPTLLIGMMLIPASLLVTPFIGAGLASIIGTALGLLAGFVSLPFTNIIGYLLGGLLGALISFIGVTAAFSLLRGIVRALEFAMLGGLLGSSLGALAGALSSFDWKKGRAFWDENIGDLVNDLRDGSKNLPAKLGRNIKDSLDNCGRAAVPAVAGATFGTRWSNDNDRSLVPVLAAA